MDQPNSKLELDSVLPALYNDLRRLASQALSGERPGRKLQTTALVHEVYVRLASLDKIQWEDDDHILRAAVGLMRHVIIDHVRNYTARKRSSDGHHSNDDLARRYGESMDPAPLLELLALDEALDRLRAFDPRKADVVELRFFGEQSVDATARILGISEATVKQDWAVARAWLQREMEPSRPTRPSEGEKEP